LKTHSKMSVYVNMRGTGTNTDSKMAAVLSPLSHFSLPSKQGILGALDRSVSPTHVTRLEPEQEQRIK